MHCSTISWCSVALYNVVVYFLHSVEPKQWYNSNRMDLAKDILNMNKGLKGSNLKISIILCMSRVGNI